MNFIKKDDEANLPKKEQPEMIVDLLRFFLILINEKYENIPNQKLISEIFEKVFPKYKLDSISKKFL